MYDLQLKYRKQIEDIVNASIRLGEIGYVTSHGGNLSYRVDEDVVLITPTKVQKKKIIFDDIIIINFKADVLFSVNDRKPTGETSMHLNLLKKRTDVKGLIHAHPPILTGFAIAGNNILSKPFLPEPTIEIGPVLEVDYKEPLSNELAAAFDKVLEKSNAFIMKNHGIMICSNEGVGRAMELLEMLESMAYSVFVANSIGKANTIPQRELYKLERTMKTRGLRMPGKLGVVKRLKDIYYDNV